MVKDRDWPQIRALVLPFRNLLLKLEFFKLHLPPIICRYPIDLINNQGTRSTKVSISILSSVVSFN